MRSFEKHSRFQDTGTLMGHSEASGDQVKVMNGGGGQQMGFEGEKIATFLGTFPARNQLSTLEEPVSFSQVGGRVSLSIGSSRLNPKPFRSKHWSMWVSQLHHCSYFSTWLKRCMKPVPLDFYHISMWELVAWCWSFCRSGSTLTKPSVKGLNLPTSDTLQVSLR